MTLSACVITSALMLTAAIGRCDQVTESLDCVNGSRAWQSVLRDILCILQP